MKMQNFARKTNKNFQVWCRCIPARWIVLILNFSGVFSLYALRMNLSAAIVSMVDYDKLYADRNSQFNLTSDSQNDSNAHNDDMQNAGSKCEHYYNIGNVSEKEQSVRDGSKKFVWDENMQGLALGCYYYGYTCSQIAGAWLARKIGRVRVWGFCILSASLCTILIPLSLEIGFEVFILARVMIGLFSGVTYPISYAMWTTWAKPTERSLFMTISRSGADIGLIVTLPLTGVLATSFGWQSVFYVTGSIGLTWSILWLVLVYDNPTDHPRISKEEKNLLLNSLGHKIEFNSNKEQSRPVPWRSILGSYRIWIMFFILFSSDFLLLTFLTLLPTYLKTIMNFDIKGSATLSAIPFIVKVVVAIFVGWFADRLLLMGMKTIYVRKLCQSIALFIPGISLIFAAYIECNVLLVILAFTLCVAAEVFTTPGVRVAILEMTLPFFGIIYSIGNTISTTTGFIVPQIAGLLRKAHQDDPIQGWRILFWISTSMICAGAVLFLIFGTTELQEWAKPHKKRENVEEGQDDQELKTCLRPKNDTY